MPSLTRNESIQTIKGDTITILDYIAEGGQGEVYKVDYKGQKYALKWYKAPVPPQVFYDNLAKNVDRGAPNEHYLWPIMLTKPYKNSYGYIMELRKPEFHEFSEFLLSQAKFLSYEVMLSAALNIVESFRLLHSLGFSYQDVNEGSFFINPNDGDVLICDNDNVAPNLVNLGVRGMPRYMAPEVVIDATRPNAQTDRFSLAVLLFRLFYIDHPLEGKYTNNLPMMDSTGAHMYGVSPVFCYDPTNEKNRPDPEAQPNVIRRWNMFPPDLQMTFIRAFTNGLKNPNDRITENEWEEALTKATKVFRMLGMNIDKTTIQRLFNSDGGESLSRALETALSIFAIICLMGLPVMKINYLTIILPGMVYMYISVENSVRKPELLNGIVTIIIIASMFQNSELKQ